MVEERRPDERQGQTTGPALFSFWLHLPVCGILVPRPGIELGLTAGNALRPSHWPPGTSQGLPWLQRKIERKQEWAPEARAGPGPQPGRQVKGSATGGRAGAATDTGEAVRACVCLEHRKHTACAARGKERRPGCRQGSWPEQRASSSRCKEVKDFVWSLEKQIPNSAGGKVREWSRLEVVSVYVVLPVTG